MNKAISPNYKMRGKHFPDGVWRIKVDKKVCTGCGKEKPIDEFRKRPGCIDGHVAQCNECIRSMQTKIREKKKEEANQFL